MFPACYGRGLDGVRPPLPRAHTDQLLDGGRPDLAVTDLSGGRGLGDDVHHVVGVVVGNDDVEAHLGDEVDGVLRTPVDLGVALLPAVATDLTHGQTLHPEALQGRLHVVELERLDDCGDEPHACTPSACAETPDPAPIGGPPAAARWWGENPPAATPPKSYAVSACSTVSMPSSSSSCVMRRPMTMSMTLAMTRVATNE